MGGKIEIITSIIILCYTNSILSCSINICLTWKLNENKLIIFCKVEKLYLNVEFIDPHENVKGNCLLPFPHSNCTSKDNHVAIWQNLSRNETVLAYTNAGEEQHGNWTCRHGSRKDAATVQINVYFANTGRSCWQQLLFWTLTGVLPSLIAIPIILACIQRSRCSDSTSIEERVSMVICNWAKEKKYFSIPIALICILIIIIAFGLPFLGIEEDSACKDEHIFIMVGFLSGVLISFMLMLLNFKGQRNNHNQPSRIDQAGLTGQRNNHHRASEIDQAGPTEVDALTGDAVDDSTV